MLKIKKPTKFADNLAESILKCAIEKGIQTTKNKKKSPKKSTPWFDSLCQKFNRDLEKLAYNLKNSPNDNDIREKMSCTKRNFKSIVKKKTNAYKHAIIEKNALKL